MPVVHVDVRANLRLRRYREYDEEGEHERGLAEADDWGGAQLQLRRYDYYAGYPHRLERVGNLYYRYDGNGNVVAEREGGHAATNSRNATVYNDGDLYYTDYGFGLFEDCGTDTKTYERRYTWNERNLLTSSVDRQYAVSYRYGADGQRAVKYAVRGSSSTETMYFNQFWTSRTTTTSALLESKHIFVGTTRVVTKLHQKGDDSVDYEGKNRYYYHSDHLGSAQLVTDFEGREYERIEYTPYGELWVEKTISGAEKLPFRFTGKEFDEETGLYYYGARYLDPKVSRWLSTDPALGEYIPGAPVNEEARKRNGNLPGMGGIYNLVNFHLYHYAGNNPVRYIDPDGRDHGIAVEAPIYNQYRVAGWVRVGEFKAEYSNTPISTAPYLHNGEDWQYQVFGNNETVGKPVYATVSGEVVGRGYNPYNPKGADPKVKGNWIRIQTEDGGFVDFYHLLEVKVKKGDKITIGFIIARAGNTGGSTGPHLHSDKYFTTEPSDYQSNPDKYLKKTYDGVTYIYFIKPPEVTPSN